MTFSTDKIFGNLLRIGLVFAGKHGAEYLKHLTESNSSVDITLSKILSV